MKIYIQNYQLMKNQYFFIYNGVEIIENNNFYYIFDLFDTFEIIFKLDKKIKKEKDFKKLLNYLYKNKSYEFKIMKKHFNDIKEFLLKIISVEQLDLIMKKIEEIVFEKGKITKAEEFRNIFYIR